MWSFPRVGDTTLSLEGTLHHRAIQRTAFTRALRVIQALNTAAIDLIITEFKLPTILLLGRSEYILQLRSPRQVLLSISQLLPVGHASSGKRFA